MGWDVRVGVGPRGAGGVARVGAVPGAFVGATVTSVGPECKEPRRGTGSYLRRGAQEHTLDTVLASAAPLVGYGMCVVSRVERRTYVSGCPS
jgi:hypothetical protein